MGIGPEIELKWGSVSVLPSISHHGRHPLKRKWPTLRLTLVQKWHQQGLTGSFYDGIRRGRENPLFGKWSYKWCSFFFLSYRKCNKQDYFAKGKYWKKIKVLQGKKKKDLTLLINMSLINRDRGEKGKGLGKNGGRMGGGHQPTTVL